MNWGEFPEGTEPEPLPRKKRVTAWVEVRPEVSIQEFAATLPAPEDTLAVTMPEPAQMSSLTASDKLESLVDLSLDRLREILSWKVPAIPAHKMEFEQVKLQLSAVGQALSAQLKVDDNRLKKQSVDMLPALLTQLREHERAQVTVEATARQVP